MDKIELNVYDLQIKELPSGQEICQIAPRLAFNESFIEAMRAKGVKSFVPEINHGDE